MLIFVPGPDACGGSETWAPKFSAGSMIDILCPSTLELGTVVT